MTEQESNAQMQMKTAFTPQFNGVHSAHSSRGHSPVLRPGNIPPSQLPPIKQNIPLSQLPPTRSTNVTDVTQKVGHLSVSDHSTPNISPNKPPPQQNVGVGGQKPYFTQDVSPITSTNVPNSFHQSQSAPVLSSVPSSVQNVNLQMPSKQLGQNLSNNNPALQNHFSQPPKPLNSNAVQASLPQSAQSAFARPFNVPNSVISPPINNTSTPTTSSINANSQNRISSFNNPQFTRSIADNQTLNSNGPVSSNPPQNFVNAIPPRQNLQPTSNALPQNAANQPLPNSFNGQNQPFAPVSSISQPPPTNFNGTTTPAMAKPQTRTGLHGNRYPTPTSGYQSQTQPSYPSQPSYPNQPSYPSQASYPNQIPSQPQSFQQPQQTHSFQSPQPQGFQQPHGFQPHQSQGFLPGQQQTNFQQPPPVLPSQQQGYPPRPQQSFQAKPSPLEQPAPIYPSQQNYQGVSSAGFNKMWGTESIDLLQTPNILPPVKIEAPQINLGQEVLDEANCSTDIFRATMTKIPANNSLLQKSRLPLGVLIHPFKDLSHLPVIQCNVIVRCRACRTYINPFVYFTDSKRWKCNLCYRINELPEEFQYDPVSKTYGDPSRRPEIRSSTIEYIAPAEYMLRPPQPAVYLYLFDVSRLAVESGYLSVVTSILSEELANIPGDARTQIGFLAYDSALHFFSLADGLSQPHEMTVLDIDDVFLPTPDNLLVNLKDRMEMIQDLLQQLSRRYLGNYDSNSALGAALQAAYKMVGATGGRVTVFQCALPNFGPGALASREDPNTRSSVEVAHLNPANDFYKRLALECSGQQIAVDLFILNSQYVDVATISGISRFSGGCISHFPLFNSSKVQLCNTFERCLRRYLTRKIGFEAVMRVRCTRGLAIHTFHGNFFVRSTDLLSLPNINPDTGFGMQVAIEESLSDVQSVCFQAALLYTSSKGERRIRVHTLCLPIASTLHEVIHSADQQTIVGLLTKMAVDRSMQANLSDAREAFINVAIDILSSYKFSLNLGSASSGLLAPECLKLLPLYISALLKHPAFRVGTSTRLDDRVKSMIDMKVKPLNHLIQMIYPDLYPIHNLESYDVIINAEEEAIPAPPRLQLTARCLENKGAFLLDTGEHMIVLVCPNVSLTFLNEGLGVADYNAISDQMYGLPELDNAVNQRLHAFVNSLNDEKPYAATVQVLRDNSPGRAVFFERLIEDRVENALSYHEFLQHLKTQVK